MNIKIFIFLTILLSACSSYQDKQLEYALELAKENRQELEKVLKHYQNSPEKLAAAHFLIQNMPYYYEYDGKQLDTVKSIIKEALKEKRVFGVKSLIIRDRKVNMNRDVFHTLEKKHDVQTITADYLIKNIDLAFKVWKERPWNKNLCFEDFCELILPYRIANEKLSDWRCTYYNRYAPLLDSLYKGNDVIEACNTLVRILKKEGFYYNAQFKIPHLDALFLIENRAGYCRETCDISLYAMRAVGIPVATDNMVYSPEYQGGHSWNVVRDTIGRFIPFLYTDYEASRDMKDDGRKKGKITRDCFGLQKNRLPVSKAVPATLRHPFSKDVTDNYFGKNEIVFHLDEYNKNEVVFLGVFHKGSWIPLDFAITSNSQAVFKNMEPNLIYQPFVEQDGIQQPIGYPFLFIKEGVQYFTPDTTILENIIIKRKYPLRDYIARAMNTNVREARIECSDTPAAINTRLLYKIKDSVVTDRNLISFDSPVKGRYIHIISAPDKPVDIAELSIYENIHDSIPVPMTLIREIKPVHTNKRFAITNITDGDPLTSFISNDSTNYITYDLGKSIKVNKLMFIPRNDGNFIWQGDTYELFYRSNSEKWKSLGKQIAASSELHYQVPRNALFWLHNHTKGTEEQVFYMQNGKQIFACDIK